MQFHLFLWECDMGLLDEVGKIAGAVAAVEATEKVDPEAGLLTKKRFQKELVGAVNP
jgi:hypothetical protein